MGFLESPSPLMFALKAGIRLFEEQMSPLGGLSRACPQPQPCRGCWQLWDVSVTLSLLWGCCSVPVPRTAAPQVLRCQCVPVVHHLGVLRVFLGGAQPGRSVPSRDKQCHLGLSLARSSSSAHSAPAQLWKVAKGRGCHYSHRNMVFFR